MFNSEAATNEALISEETDVAKTTKKKAPSKKKTTKKAGPRKKAATKKTAKKAAPKKKTAAKKTAKKAAPKKKTAAKKIGTSKKTAAKRAKGKRGRIANKWDLVTLDEIIAYKNASGLSDKQLAKKFGVSSIARMKVGAAPVTETQEQIRKVIDGKVAAARKTPAASASTPARNPSGKRGREKAVRTPSEGLMLLMQAILDEDWDLARAAYDRLK